MRSPPSQWWWGIKAVVKLPMKSGDECFSWRGGEPASFYRPLMNTSVERVERQDAAQLVLHDPSLCSFECREDGAREAASVAVEHPAPFVVLAHDRITSRSRRTSVAWASVPE